MIKNVRVKIGYKGCISPPLQWSQGSPSMVFVFNVLLLLQDLLLAFAHSFPWFLTRWDGSISPQEAHRVASRYVEQKRYRAQRKNNSQKFTLTFQTIGEERSLDVRT